MVALYQHMASIIAQIRDISGLNEMVDGSTASQDRMPNGLIEANAESANNALFGIIDAEKCLLEKLATSCFKRLQIAIKSGDYGGYINAIGGNSVKLIKVSPDLALHEFAIMCEVRPTDEMKQLIIQEMQPNIAAGFLDLSDVLIILDMYSTRKAYQLLAYKVKKNKALMQDNAMQQQQMNGQVQIQSAQATEQMKQQGEALKHQYDMEYLNREIEGNLAVQELKNKTTETAAALGVSAKIITDSMSSPDVAAQPQQMQQPQPAMAQ
jgi:hypothetical protein